MVEAPNQSQFRTSRSKLSLADAIAKARLAIGAITSAPVDTINKCARTEDGNWSVTVEVVEREARMGDNDLLSVYELITDPEGELLEFHRSRRYHRETGADS